jgi:hypothetical protein
MSDQTKVVSTVSEPRQNKTGEARFSVSGLPVKIRVAERSITGAIKTALAGNDKTGKNQGEGGVDFALYFILDVGAGKRFSYSTVEAFKVKLDGWLKSTKDKLSASINKKKADLAQRNISIQEDKGTEIELMIHTPYSRKFIEIFELINTEFEYYRLFYLNDQISSQDFNSKTHTLKRQCQDMSGIPNMILKKVLAEERVAQEQMAAKILAETNAIDARPLVALLYKLTTTLKRKDGWTEVKRAGFNARKDLPLEVHNLQKNYGFQKLKHLLESVDLFEVRDEPLKGGGMNTLYRIKETPSPSKILLEKDIAAEAVAPSIETVPETAGA